MFLCSLVVYFYKRDTRYPRKKNVPLPDCGKADYKNKGREGNLP